VCACGAVYFPRKSDVKRGWGKSCSKSCAAIKSNKETGKYERFKAREAAIEDGTYDPDNTACHAEGGGWDDHKF
jgi:hypothetical protein